MSLHWSKYAWTVAACVGSVRVKLIVWHIFTLQSIYQWLITTQCAFSGDTVSIWEKNGMGQCLPLNCCVPFREWYAVMGWLVINNGGVNDMYHKYLATPETAFHIDSYMVYFKWIMKTKLFFLQNIKCCSLTVSLFGFWYNVYCLLILTWCYGIAVEMLAIKWHRK